ncbi:MAG: hypothetical protein EOO39_41315 [Cytophagaceae bacterium]|nr:MAG: hypothetical protein EOO39_41315 [Cytophagaceae bacterium]
MEFTVRQIATLLGGEVEGDETLPIRNIAKIEEGAVGDISFLANLKYEPHLYTTGASAVIVNRDFRPQKPVTASLIYVDNSYSAFTQLLEQYHQQINFARSGVEDPSFVGSGTAGSTLPTVESAERSSRSPECRKEVCSLGWPG